MSARIYRIWELLVIRWVYLTGKGKRTREWKHYVRSEGSKKGWKTRRLSAAIRKGRESGLFHDRYDSANVPVPESMSQDSLPRAQ